MKDKPQPSTTSSTDKNSEVLKGDTMRAALIGVISAAAILLGSWIINMTSGGAPRILLESMLPSVRSLCSAVMTASSTILALMLTMLSLSSGQGSKFKPDYFERTKQIAMLDTAVFIAAILLLSFISVPLSESQDVPENWYMILYYFTLTATAVLSGSLIAVVIMLYNAVKGLIRMLHPKENSGLVKDKN